MPGRGRWGPVGLLGTSSLHTCGPSGCAHMPWGQGTWAGGLLHRRGKLCDLNRFLVPWGSQDTPPRKVRAKWITGLWVGKPMPWSVPGEEGWGIQACV